MAVGSRVQGSESMPEPAKRLGAAQATCESRALLAINGGSSGIRFALYDAGDQPRRLLDGKVDRIGQKGTNLTFQERPGNHCGADQRQVALSQFVSRRSS